MAERKDVAERKDKEPVFGRLDDLDDISSLPLGLRNGASDDRESGSYDASTPRLDGNVRPRRDDVLEPGPPVSVVGSLTARTQSSPVEMEEASPGHPGAAMRHSRERAGIDIADLASRTRLSRRIIEDLEANRFQAMPPAYVRGYLRAVARELNNDAETWIRSYEGLGYAEPVLKATVQRDGSGRWGLSRGIWGLTVAAILASALGLGVYTWSGGNGEAPMAGVADWFGEQVQRFVGAAPEPLAEPEPGPPGMPEPAEELEWVPGPEAPGQVDGPLPLDPAPPEPLLQEPGLPVVPTEPAAPAPEPELAPEPAPERPLEPSAAVPAPATEPAPVAPEAGLTAAPAPDPGVST
ncbi:MAG: helix-turn-helix domain-containing protein, partial [Thioalkalivibrio sp.]|nr:helix-turn-helix domain-containing protein [Thioalkalivibrio sp.]